jgi:hypothetical protein
MWAGVIDMVDDDVALAALRADYGQGWFLGRTYREDGAANWWKAKRKGDLSDTELDRGLVMTLLYDTAPLLREALIAQTDLEQRAKTALSHR